MGLTTMRDASIVPGADFRDRRRHRRVEVAIPGRIALTDGSEHDCVTRDISTARVALKTPKAIAIGEHLVVDLDEVGRLEGTVVRIVRNCVVLNLNLNAHKRGRLARRIEIFKARQLANSPRHEVRVVAGNMDRSMKRFYKNLRIVVEKLVRASPAAR
jgi:hypothetical protein